MDTFIGEILASCEWRVRELENLKKIGVISLSSNKNDVKSQYYKMCVPYVYANWEGFVIEIFKLLITYINNLKLPKQLVIQNLYTFSLIDTFRPLSGKQKFDQCCQFTKEFHEQFGKELYIKPALFKTNSNLNYKQLVIILDWFGMVNNFESYEYIINKLVNQRNCIAHGENGIIIKYEDIACFIDVLYEIFDKMILTFNEYLTNKSYLA